MTIETTPIYTKEIKFDKVTRDHAMYLNGKLVGYAATRHEAEVELDRLVYEALTHGGAA